MLNPLRQRPQEAQLCLLLTLIMHHPLSKELPSLFFCISDRFNAARVCRRWHHLASDNRMRLFVDPTIRSAAPANFLSSSSSSSFPLSSWSDGTAVKLTPTPLGAGSHDASTIASLAVSSSSLRLSDSRHLTPSPNPPLSLAVARESVALRSEAQRTCVEVGSCCSASAGGSRGSAPVCGLCGGAGEGGSCASGLLGGSCRSGGALRLTRDRPVRQHKVASTCLNGGHAISTGVVSGNDRGSGCGWALRTCRLQRVFPTLAAAVAAAA